jgi:hypothetical protein
MNERAERDRVARELAAEHRGRSFGDGEFSVPGLYHSLFQVNVDGLGPLVNVSLGDLTVAEAGALVVFLQQLKQRGLR